MHSACALEFIPATLAGKVQVYQERAQGFVEAGDGEAQLEALQKWIRAAEMSGDPAALAQAHMQLGLAQQQQVLEQNLQRYAVHQHHAIGSYLEHD